MYNYELVNLLEKGLIVVEARLGIYNSGKMKGKISDRSLLHLLLAKRKQRQYHHHHHLRHLQISKRIRKQLKLTNNNKIRRLEKLLHMESGYQKSCYNRQE